MRVGRFGPWLVLSLLVLFQGGALADSWPRPKVEVYYSQNHRSRFTVTPRDISSPLAYFDGKLKNDKHAGQTPGSKQTFARGVLEKQDDRGRWTIVWDHPLVNDVSPVSAVVANSARYVVTFDNWHSMGWGDDAIVIYGPNGTTIRSFSLQDILPEDYVYALPRTVSSIWWSGKHHIAEPQDILVLQIVVPSNDNRIDDPNCVDLSLLLQTGAVLPSTDAAWQNALTEASKVAKARHADEEEEERWFRSPLLAPKNTTEPDWHRYLLEAFYRLNTDTEHNSAWTTVLRAPDADDFAASEKWVRDDFDPKDDLRDVVMLASPASPERLLQVMESAIRALKPNALKGRRVFVCVPAAYRARVEEILAPTGATFVYLDPDVPIPQRKERLDRFLGNAPQ